MSVSTARSKQVVFLNTGNDDPQGLSSESIIFEGRVALDYSELVPGQQISHQRFALDFETVGRYRNAVGDHLEPITVDEGDATVPPMALAALSLRGVIGDLGIPGGTVHAGQELDFRRALTVGESVECKASVLQNSTRGGWRFLVVELSVAGDDKSLVMEGKSTLMLPV